MHGGRFNPIGVPALYTPLTHEGAIRERIGLARTQPVITCEYEIDIEPIFDSFSQDDCKALGIRLSDLDCAWEDAVSLGETPASHLVSSKETVENKVLIGAISAWGIFKNSESTHFRDPARKRPDFHLKKGEKGRSDPTFSSFFAFLPCQHRLIPRKLNSRFKFQAKHTSCHSVCAPCRPRSFR